MSSNTSLSVVSAPSSRQFAPFDGDDAEVEALFAELKRALHEEGRVAVERQLDAAATWVVERLAALQVQATAVADANALAVEILIQQRAMGEELTRQNANLIEQHRRIDAQRADLEAQMDALANANVDAVLQVQLSEQQLVELSEEQLRLADSNSQLAAQARELEREAMALADSNVDAVQLLIDNEERLATLAEKTRDMEAAKSELEEKAFVDELTGLFNHRYLKEQLILEVARARRYGRELSVIFVDADHFKHLNDTHGHQTGDVVLRTLGQLLRSEVRSADVTMRLDATPFAVRYGGEEFVVLLPETDLPGACVVAERLRSRVAETSIVGGDTQPLGRVTVSLGVAALNADDKDGLSMIRRADEALYRAKRAGRDRVEVSDRLS